MMRRAIRGAGPCSGALLVLAAGCSVRADAGREAPECEAERYYPLAAGTAWTYEVTHVTDLARRGTLVAAAWTAELRVAERFGVREGVVALLETRTYGLRILRAEGASGEELAALAEDLPRRTEPRGLLARGGMLYSLPAWGWDDAQRSLASEYAALLERTWPRLVFPLRAGLAWAERPLGAVSPGDGRSAWVVKGREKLALGALGVPEAWLVECVSPGGVARVWFAEGVGIAREEFVGCCSRSEDRRELVGFASGASGTGPVAVLAGP